MYFNWCTKYISLYCYWQWKNKISLNRFSEHYKGKSTVKRWTKNCSVLSIIGWLDEAGLVCGSNNKQRKTNKRHISRTPFAIDQSLRLFFYQLKPHFCLTHLYLSPESSRMRIVRRIFSFQTCLTGQSGLRWMWSPWRCGVGSGGVTTQQQH